MTKKVTLQELEALKKRKLFLKKAKELKELRDRCKNRLWYFIEHIESNKDEDDKFFTRDKPHLIWMSLLYDLMRERVFEDISVSMPRRYGKSYSGSMFMAHYIGHNPLKTNMRNSYSTRLAMKHSVTVKTIIESPEFIKIFPEAKIAPDRKAKDEWALEVCEQYNYICTGVDGSATGIGANGVLCLDDPIKNMTEAYSDVIMGHLQDWHNSVHMSGLEKGALNIDIATRWADHDIIGMKYKIKNNIKLDYKYWLEKLMNATDNVIERIYIELKDNILSKKKRKDDCVVVVIPALDDKNMSTCEAIRPTVWLRQEKEKFHRFGLNYIFEAMYQQNPIGKSGFLVSIDDVKSFTLEDVNGEHAARRFGYCDPAFGGGDSLAFVIVYLIKGEFYLMDVVFSKDGPTNTSKKVVDKILQHGLNKVVFESNNGGRLFMDKIKQESQDRGSLCIFKAKATSKDKESRFTMAVEPIIEKLKFRSDYKENTDYDFFVREFFSTPKNVKLAKHDDAFDAVTGFIENFISSSAEISVSFI